jgi:hypothetical protein
VQDHKRRVQGKRRRKLTQQQRSHSLSLSDEQLIALTLFGTCQEPLEQLAHHAEREADLKLGATRSQDLMTQLSCASARRVQERGLADAGPGLNEDCTAVLDQVIYRRQLTLALKQPLHENTLGRIMLDGLTAALSQFVERLAPHVAVDLSGEIAIASAVPSGELGAPRSSSLRRYP